MCRRNRIDRDPLHGELELLAGNHRGDTRSECLKSLKTLYLRPGPELDFLPTVEAFQRHELTLLRMEDILNTGSGSKPSGLESAGLESNGQGRWDKLCKI